jgi:IstB-like ATP binding protein
MALAVTGWTVCRFHGARGGGTKGERNGKYRQWTSILQSQRLTGALLDRVTHHVHILELSGESFRLKQSKARRRVKVDPETRKTISAS